MRSLGRIYLVGAMVLFFCSPGVRAESSDVIVVRSGDTLSRLSIQVYGTARVWRKIYEANLDRMSNPDRLVVGQVLRVPQSTANVDVTPLTLGSKPKAVLKRFDQWEIPEWN